MVENGTENTSTGDPPVAQTTENTASPDSGQEWQQLGKDRKPKTPPRSILRPGSRVDGSMLSRDNIAAGRGAGKARSGVRLIHTAPSDHTDANSKMSSQDSIDTVVANSDDDILMSEDDTSVQTINDPDTKETSSSSSFPNEGNKKVDITGLKAITLKYSSTHLSNIQGSFRTQATKVQQIIDTSNLSNHPCLAGLESFLTIIETHFKEEIGILNHDGTFEVNTTSLSTITPENWSDHFLGHYNKAPDHSVEIVLLVRLKGRVAKSNIYMFKEKALDYLKAANLQLDTLPGGKSSIGMVTVGWLFLLSSKVVDAEETIRRVKNTWTKGVNALTPDQKNLFSIFAAPFRFFCYQLGGGGRLWRPSRYQAPA